ncbi:MAG: hypothetical protein PHW52_03725 [Candidatus Pacebacteria bacterium]|nr:hypothetical protein [Candidatus Paceibacterota bacterium]
MGKKRDWIEGEWVWGYKPNTNIRVHGRVDNANGLIDGYVHVWTEGKYSGLHVIHVDRTEDPRYEG